MQVTVGGLAFFVLWMPVLLHGRFPRRAVRWVGGYLEWELLVAAFAVGLTDHYPPFTLEAGSHPISTEIPAPEARDRCWAVPMVGYLVKLLILVPHFICLVVIGAAVVLLWLVMWLPLFG